MKTGLLLEGGAMRGLDTAGVLDVFMQNNISADGIVAVSAGALFGMNYKSKQPGRVLRYNRKMCIRDRHDTGADCVRHPENREVLFGHTGLSAGIWVRGSLLSVRFLRGKPVHARAIP